MVWVVLILLAVAVAAVAAALIAGRLPYDPMSEPVRSTPATGLPEGPASGDVDSVRFDTAARGYRMSEVDDVLDSLQGRLASQEAELAALRTEHARTEADPDADADADRVDAVPPDGPEAPEAPEERG